MDDAERTSAEETETTYNVVENRLIEVAPTHVEVPADEPAREPAPEAERPVEETLPYGARRYLAFVAGRRANRFLTSSLAMAVLTIVAGVWFLLGAAGLGKVQSFTDTSVAMGGVAILGVGFVLAWLCHRGNLAGLTLAWLAGLVSVAVAVGMLSTIPAYPAGVGDALLGAMALFGLMVLVATTLGLASWRGARTQRRILGRATG